MQQDESLQSSTVHTDGPVIKRPSLMAVSSNEPELPVAIFFFTHSRRQSMRSAAWIDVGRMPFLPTE